MLYHPIWWTHCLLFHFHTHTNPYLLLWYWCTLLFHIDGSIQEYTSISYLGSNISRNNMTVRLFCAILLLLHPFWYLSTSYHWFVVLLNLRPDSYYLSSLWYVIWLLSSRILPRLWSSFSHYSILFLSIIYFLQSYLGKVRNFDRLILFRYSWEILYTFIRQELLYFQSLSDSWIIYINKWYIWLEKFLE